MNIRIDDIQTPCSVCMNHFNHEFDGDSSDCKSCDYNITVQFLKRVVKDNDYCSLCTHVVWLGGGYFECELGDEVYERCREECFMDIDYKELAKAYEVPLQSEVEE